MFLAERFHRTSTIAVVACLLLANFGSLRAASQQPASLPQLAPSEPTAIAQPLPEDRGEAGLEQALKRLSTTASVLMIVAHPDDEDGSLLTFLSRGKGARATLFTLNRGEGGQNEMSGESYDALGLI